MKNKVAIAKGTIFTSNQCYENHALLINDECIVGIVADQDVPTEYTLIDVNGAYVCPGLIDLQIYGTGDTLFSAELTADSINTIEQQLLKQGCTSFYLTLATNTIEVFKQAIAVFKEANATSAMGLHLEGPFLNPLKRGAHPEELIIQADKNTLDDLLMNADGVVKMMTIAPELMEDECVQQLLSYNILLSAGHSAATVDQAKQFYDRGIKAATHLWNAMSAVHHRDIGLAGELLIDSDLQASIIVDGIHVSYEAVRLSKSMMKDRLFLITDAVGACEKGIYKHQFAGDHFALPDGTLSGSSLTMLQAIANCVNKVGIPLDEAIRMATSYPAQLIGRDDIGNLESGSIANVLVFTKDFEVQDVFYCGERI